MPLKTTRPFRPRLSIAAAVFGMVWLLACFAAPSAFATTYYWDSDGINPGFGTAAGIWASPTPGSSTQGWSTSTTGGSVPGSVTTTTSDILNFGNGATGLAAGTITVSGTVNANQMTFATGSGAMILTGGTIALGGTSPAITANKTGQTIGSALTLNTNASVVCGVTGTFLLSLNGPIDGSGNLTFTTANANFNNSTPVVNLGNANTYSGDTLITVFDTTVGANNNLTVKATVANALPPTTVLTLDGGNGVGSGRTVTYDLNGNNQTLAGLSNVSGRNLRTQRILNSTGTATLTINNPANRTFGGNINGTGLSLTKAGPGTQILSATNAYTGNTTINAGVLEMGGAGRLGNGNYAGNISVASGAALVFNSSSTTTLSGIISGAGTLTGSSTGTITISGTAGLANTVAESGGTIAINGGLVSLLNVKANGQVSLPGPTNGTVTNLVCASAATMSFNFSTATTVAQLTVAAANGITNNGGAGSVTINISGSVPADGTYTLVNYSGSLLGSGFSAYQLGAVPSGKSYGLANAAGALQLTVGSAPDFIRVETKADGTGVAVPDDTVQVGTSLTTFAIARAGDGTFQQNIAATWILTNITGAVVGANLVAAPDGKSAVFQPSGVGSARIQAMVNGRSLVGSGTITSIGLNTRPFIWVRDSDKSTILAKISSNAWATSMYNGMVSRAAAAVASHQTDRDSYLRGLPVNWTAAPPTFNSSGYGYNTGEAYFNTALDCAVLYYLTSDVKYARCAADLLHNSVQAFQNLAPFTSSGNGGWLIPSDLLYEARQVGGQLPVAYDFLYQYLLANQVYDVETAGLANFSFTDAQYVFRTYYQLVRDHGQKDSNWSALMSTCMLNSLLALDSPTERAAALQIYLTTGSSRQASLSYDYQKYVQPGDIWPESLQYSGGVGEIRSTHMVLLERYDPTLNLFGAYPNLPTSLPRISYLRYPNGEQISFGDGHRSGQGHPYFRYELMYQHALARGRTNLTSLFGSLINGGVATGAYNRSTVSAYSKLGQHDEPLELLWQAPTVTEPSVTPELPRTDTLPFAGIALQRNPAPTSNSSYGLMGFIGGAAHVHSHASGMSMELYGMGEVMGAKSGRTTYGDPDNENHYRLFAANNTIIVNGASRGEGPWGGFAINTVQTVAMEPQSQAAAVSPNFSFTCSSFADNKGTLAEGTQQRTLAIVRTSPTSGYYVDVFRSKSTVTNRVATTLDGSVTNQYHDYIYRNIGETAVDLRADGVSLPLVSQPTRFQNDIGDANDQPGWRYFTNTVVSYPTSQSVRAQFVATVSGTARYMDMHMPAVASREYAKVDSPSIVDAPSPYDTRVAPTLVIRQIGEAWDKAFATVFEPHFVSTGGTGGTVQNVTQLLRSGVVVGVKVESTVAGNNLVHYILSNPGAAETYTDAAIGLFFTGRFGVVSDNGDGTTTLYLGEGSSLSYGGYSLATVSGTSSQAEALFVPGQPPQVTANSPVNAGVAPPAGITWVPTAASTGLDWTADTNWSQVPFPNAVGSFASMNIDIVGSQTVNINNPITLGALIVGDSSGSQTTLLQKNTNGSLVFDQPDTHMAYLTRTANGTGTVTLNDDLNVTLNDDLTVRLAGGSASSTMVIAGNLSGPGGSLTKESASLTLTLSGNNTYTGTTTVNGGTLSLGGTGALGSTSGITLAGGATLRPDVVGAVINAPITLGNSGTTSTFNAPSIAGAGGSNAVPITLGGAIGGAGNVTFSGIEIFNAYGTVILNAASSYAGSTLVTCTGSTNTEIFVMLGITNALPTTTVLTLDGGNGTGSGRFCDLNLNGCDQTLAGLTNVTGRTLRSQRVNNPSATPATLTINESGSRTFSGQLGGGGTNFGLTKSGVGVLTLTGALSYKGNTTITGGTLSLGAVNTNNELSTVTIDASGALLQLTFAGTDTVARLFIGTSQKPAGIYGHSASGATNGGLGVGALDAYFVASPGTLTITSSTPLNDYAAWKAANAPVGTTSDDFDGDGVANGIEYVLGGTASANDLGKLPAISISGGNMVFSFQRAQSSIDGITILTIEVGADLAVWPDIFAVPATAVASNPGVTVVKDAPGVGFDTVTLTLPQAPDGRNFIRVKVVP